MIVTRNKDNGYRYTEGYPDPTAGDAIEHIVHEQREARRKKHPAEVKTEIVRLRPRTLVWRKK